MKALLLIGLMIIVFPAQADAYKCRDAGGRTVYQEKPCETANMKAIGKVAKPVGEASQEAIEKSQAEVKASNQRDSERKKAEQEAAQKEAAQQEAAKKEAGQQKTGQPNERMNGGQY